MAIAAARAIAPAPTLDRGKEEQELLHSSQAILSRNEERIAEEGAIALGQSNMKVK